MIVTLFHRHLLHYLFKRAGRHCVGGVLVSLEQKPQVQALGPHKTGEAVHACKPGTLEVKYQDQKFEAFLDHTANLKQPVLHEILPPTPNS